jgi:hypothetical protein
LTHLYRTWDANALYNFGIRKFNIIHCQLRNEASNLKAHLSNDFLSNNTDMVVAQMRQMPHFWNGKCNLWKQIKSFFFKICLNSPPLPHFIQTRPMAVTDCPNCRGPLEDNNHFLFICPKYNNIRLVLLDSRQTHTHIHIYMYIY